MDIPLHTEIVRLEDFIGTPIVQVGLGVNASFVRKCAEACNRIVEGDIDMYGFGDEILDFVELSKLVL